MDTIKFEDTATGTASGAPQATSVAKQRSAVWSWNEWDPLEEVIVGNPLNARFPYPDVSTQLAEFPDRELDQMPRGPFPQKVLEEADEDVNEFVQVLEKQGVTVRRPETWPHEAKFSTINWESEGYYNTVLAISCWSSATRSSRRPT